MVKRCNELQLRNKYNLTVLTVRRGDKTFGNPSGDFEIQPGDRLIMVGLAGRFAECADLFRESESR
ncbi:MAG: TrkA C-terminal domain-containing protein [Balneolaceae bacterium]|nr:TrkA C-terminal domain-containing protein [Balneolaceae bacterium]